MRLLVLGGTVFLSKAVAEEAVRRGHEVTCACRGESGLGARRRPARACGTAPSRRPTSWPTTSYDAVVDVARHPSRVRAAVAALPGRALGLRVDDQRLRRRLDPGRHARDAAAARADHRGRRPAEDLEAYGPMKVACEQIVLDGAASSMVIRPGLIVGPGDPTGRFTYWPRRGCADGGEVLAPGRPTTRAGRRRPRPGGLDRRRRRGPAHRRLRRRRPGRCRSATCSARSPTGVGADAASPGSTRSS